MSLRALIADDEPLARALLREFLAAHPDVQYVTEAENGLEAARCLQDEAPELVFLDIQMPKLSGLEVLALTGRREGVIFTTAYEQHALAAFELHAVDYLLKPFSQQRFDAALDKARRLRGRPPPGLAALLPVTLERVLIREGAALRVLALAEVECIEAQGDYVAFHVAGREHLQAQRLSALEAQLDPGHFVRVHRSFILRLAALASLERTDSDGHAARLRSGKRIPVSRAGLERLRRLL